jgi:hypothetical protein
MCRQRIACLSIVGPLSLSLACTAVAPHSDADDKKDSGEVPAVKKVEDQADAIAEARAADLPLVGKADRAVIEESKPPRGKGRRVTLTNADDIKELRQALKPRKVSPSGSVTAATITFYRGKSLLRKLWVFEGGEWGFERPGTSWTTGREANLWEAVQKHLK